MSSIREKFWNPRVWLPPGYEWKDLVPNEKVQYANWNDLWSYPLVMALMAIALRFLILDKFVFGPLASYCGLKNVKHKPVQPHPTLETFFRKFRHKAPESEIKSMAKEIGWKTRAVERWLRQRVAMTRVNKYTKFMECAWQLTYYTFIFFFGLYVMFGKPWLWDILHCWYEYPNHSLDNDVWWYYMLSLAFYWSMIITHFFESRRKDFWQMFFHHVVTVVLITFSWTCNFTRIGTLVLIIHDCADIPLQGAKLCIYLKKKALCDAVFALFAIMWIVTRVGIYPLWIIRSTTIEAPKLLPMFPAYYIFNSLLITLLVLHVYWTYLILRIIANTFTQGEVQDDRSSSSDDSSHYTGNGDKED